jgi:hypothetical protein
MIDRSEEPEPIGRILEELGSVDVTFLDVDLGELAAVLDDRAAHMFRKLVRIDRRWLDIKPLHILRLRTSSPLGPAALLAALEVISLAPPPLRTSAAAYLDVVFCEWLEILTVQHRVEAASG